ncbi:MAG TPA: O-antigen ligase family protein [Sphingomicrobium sp.]|nr:O-antigen ligase family protein [Sphingomicrobium sp.]
MLNRAREAIGPAYLFACLILGGSAQGIWQNMILQLAGVAIIAWAAAAPADEPLLPPAKQLLLLAIVGILVIALQLVPLPPAVWSSLGPRHEFVEGYRALRLGVPALPLSMTPAETLDSLLAVIPPLAIFCAVVRLRAFRPGWLAIALLAGTVAGILIGALQVASSSSGQSPWYLYEDTNVGAGVGFFANANHMAILLVVSLPFLAAIAATARRSNVQRYSAVLALTIGIALVVMVGLALNRSLAGYGLALPVLAASALIVLPSSSPLRIWAVVLASLLVIAAIFGLEVTSIGSAKFGQEASTSVQSRADILATTTTAMKDFLPFGSGLGSFRRVYHLYERPEQVTNIYVIHAHNDYVELALELGVAGMILMALFLAWWAVAVWRVWRTAEAGPFARAASIASAAILVHSVVDFPLRTAAISACFAMCIALLADRRAPRAKEPSDLRPARHTVIR